MFMNMINACITTRYVDVDNDADHASETNWKDKVTPDQGDLNTESNSTKQHK